MQAYYRRHFRAITVNTRGAQDVTGFSGKALPEREFARTAGVRISPTFQFYAPDGTLLATHAGAIYNPAEFMLLGEYVASGAYRNADFATYKQSKHKRGS